MRTTSINSRGDSCWRGVTRAEPKRLQLLNAAFDRALRCEVLC